MPNTTPTTTYTCRVKEADQAFWQFEERFETALDAAKKLQQDYLLKPETKILVEQETGTRTLSFTYIVNQDSTLTEIATPPTRETIRKDYPNLIDLRNLCFKILIVTSIAQAVAFVELTREIPTLMLLSIIIQVATIFTITTTQILLAHKRDTINH